MPVSWAAPISDVRPIGNESASRSACSVCGPSSSYSGENIRIVASMLITYVDPRCTIVTSAPWAWKSWARS